MKSLLYKQVSEMSHGEAGSANYLDINNQVSITYTDNTESMETAVLDSKYAVLNAYRMWLRSEQYDYIRAPEFGGHFGEVIRAKFPLREENEDAVSAYVKECSEKEWPEIQVIEVKTEARIKTREWYIELTARDTTSGLVLQFDDSFDSKE